MNQTGIIGGCGWGNRRCTVQDALPSLARRVSVGLCENPYGLAATMMNAMTKHSLPPLALCGLIVLVQAALGQNPALEGYANHEAFSAQVKELDASDFVAVTSLGKSVGGRDVWLLTIGTGKT